MTVETRNLTDGFVFISMGKEVLIKDGNGPGRDQHFADCHDTEAAVLVADLLMKHCGWTRPEDTIRAAFQAFFDSVVQDECTHEHTHRGGSIWTICDDCDRKWADDMGGFPGYVEPKNIAAARAALEQGEKA